jgi:site-specific recombinase XerD
MPLRKRGQMWHYRFIVNGQEYSGSTDLLATEANRTAGERYEKRERQRVFEGRSPDRNKDFATIAGEFIPWCVDVQYRQKPNTAARIKTSFASAVSFFGTKPIRDIDASEIEKYKAYRLQVNHVREVTVRHDLHALSLFFQYAERMRWREGNPVRKVKIPSDRDSVRNHVLSPEEENKYFEAAYEVVDLQGRRNLHDVAKIMINQGCRPEEIMSARKTI